MGLGVWSMHFIGMLAFDLPIALGYDLPITLLSLALAIASSVFALWLVSLRTLPHPRLAGGALLMGTGIAGMHYVGMAAMRMQPGIDYDPGWLLLSLVVAVAASWTALYVAFRLRAQRTRVGDRLYRRPARPGHRRHALHRHGRRAFPGRQHLRRRGR